jgi:hypothetical protein
VVVNAEAGNYAEQSKIIALSEQENSVKLTLMMLAVDHTEVFDPSSQTTIAVPGSTALVNLGASNALVDENDNLAAGSVTAKLTVIDPTQDSSVMPGNFSADDGTGNVGSIESFGAMTATFENAQGEHLNLGSGQQATVRIPLKDKSGNPPASIPLYYYNTTTGRWVQEGTASLVDTGDPDTSYYEGSVSHFSTWNADILYQRVMINGCVEDLDGNPVSGITVTSSGDDYTGTASTTTDSDGRFSVAAKPSSSVLVYGSSSGKKTNTKKVQTSSGDYNMDTCLKLGTISASVKLTWGEQPHDLDSHLVGPSYHVYYASRGSLEYSPYAELDVDDTSSFGPEVITVINFPEAGSYTYSVHNYSGQYDSTITDSPARVELNLDGDVHRFVPPAGEGSNLTWEVFAFDVAADGGISVRTINQWRASSP